MNLEKDARFSFYWGIEGTLIVAIELIFNDQLLWFIKMKTFIGLLMCQFIKQKKFFPLRIAILSLFSPFAMDVLAFQGNRLTQKTKHACKFETRLGSHIPNFNVEFETWDYEKQVSPSRFFVKHKYYVKITHANSIRLYELKKDKCGDNGNAIVELYQYDPEEGIGDLSYYSLWCNYSVNKSIINMLYNHNDSGIWEGFILPKKEYPELKSSFRLYPVETSECEYFLPR